MAGSGKLRPQDGVRLAPEVEWRTADRLKGLSFAVPPSECTAAASSSVQTTVPARPADQTEPHFSRMASLVRFGGRSFRETASFLLGLGATLLAVPAMVLATVRTVPLRARYGRLLFEHRLGQDAVLQKLDKYEAAIQSSDIKQNLIVGWILHAWFSLCRWLEFVRLGSEQTTARLNSDVERIYWESQEQARTAKCRVRDAFRAALPVDRASTLRVACATVLATLPVFIIWTVSVGDDANSSQIATTADPATSSGEAAHRTADVRTEPASFEPSKSAAPKSATLPRPQVAPTRAQAVAIDLNPQSAYRQLELIRFEMADMPFVLSFQVAGSTSENEYEIVVANQRALLRTYFTRFESNGWAKMAVVRDGSAPIVTKSGFNATWPLFREALSDAGAFALSVEEVTKRTAEITKRRQVAMWSVIVGLMEEGFAGDNLETLITHLGTVRSEESIRDLQEIQTRFSSARQSDGDGLVSAVRSESIDVVRAVLAHRKEHATAPKSGPNIIFFALNYFRAPAELEEFLGLLSEYGVGIEAADGEGRTAVHAAAVGNDSRKLESLIGLGANLNAADSRGATPLHLVAGEYRIDVAKLLLGAGAAVDAVDADGRTPIFYAAMKGQREMIDLLLQHNASLKIQDQQGCTVLHHAAKGCQLETVQKLVAKGADKSQKDKAGLAPAAYARDHSGIREELATRAVVSLGNDEAWGLVAADATLRTGWVEDRIDGVITKRRLHGSEVWRTTFEGADARYPCLTADGSLFFWVNKSYGKGTIVGVDPNGKIACEVAVNEHASPLAADAGGTVYFTVLGKLRAVDRQGKAKWDLPIEDDERISLVPPTIGSDGTIYVECHDPSRKAGLLAVSPAGQRKWLFVATETRSQPLLARPSFASDGTILVGYRDSNSDEGKLYAVNSAGAKKWEVLVGDMNNKPAAAGADGVSYVCGSALYAISADGKKLWKADVNGSFAPVVGRNGDIYVIDGFGTVSRVRPDGSRAGEARFSMGRTVSAFEHGMDHTLHLFFHSGELLVIDYSLF